MYTQEQCEYSTRFSEEAQLSEDQGHFEKQRFLRQFPWTELYQETSTAHSGFLAITRPDNKGKAHFLSYFFINKPPNEYWDIYLTP